MLFYFAKRAKNGGGVAFHNSGHKLALGNVNDIRCLQKITFFVVCLI